MPRETLTFDGDTLRDERIERLFGGGSQEALRQLYADAQETDWFTGLHFRVPINEYGVDQPMLYLGIDPDEDESGVETYDILEQVKNNEYVGVSYKYYDDDTPVGLAMVLGVSHKPNNELDTSDLL